MNNFSEADHPRGGNPNNPGQFSAKTHKEAECSLGDENIPLAGLNTNERIELAEDSNAPGQKGMLPMDNSNFGKNRYQGAVGITVTEDTQFFAPGNISQTRPWTGTIGDLCKYRAIDGILSTIETMQEDDRLPDKREDEDFDGYWVEDILDRLTWSDLEHIFDDPNVVALDHNGNHQDRRAELPSATNEDGDSDC